MIGKVHSIQSLAATDGPGIRFAVFLKGCPLRCGCCHNPDTWDFEAALEYTPKQILEMAKRYKEYFGDTGGVTISGGEPLLQSGFVYEVFSLCKQNGINTCLDTSGCILNDDVKKALSLTDMVLLDIKYTTDDLYKTHVGCSLQEVMRFLDYLEEQKIPVTIRQVIIPTLNDNDENILKLKKISNDYSVIEKTELLPFRKLCEVKYDNLGIDFPFSHIPEPTKEKMAQLEKILYD